MVGKRIIFFKRPAVLFATAFATGIVLTGYSVWLFAGIAAGLFTCGVICLRKLQRGKSRVSVSDKLLLFTPLFLAAGFFVMSSEKAAYEVKRVNFAHSMESGRQVLASGRVSHIGMTDNGIRFELEDAKTASYIGEEEVYRPVGTVIVYADDMLAENGELKDGQRIFLYGKGSEFGEASSPGAFDAKQYYFSGGITGAIYGKTIRITDFSYHRLNQALFQAKQKLLKNYVTYFGQEGAGVISSMLFGERALLADETKTLYRQGGISHILAISGLHVSMLGMLLYNALKKTILGRNGAIPFACAGVLLYGSFVEAGTSTKRAVIMFLLLLFATALGRTYDTLSAMSVSLIVILGQAPGALFTASFQLSFAAAYGASVLSILLTEKKKEYRVEDRWFRLCADIWERVRRGIIFGVAIQAATFPFTVYHFFDYPVCGFILNPVVIPMMTILLLCGMLSGICGLFVPWLGYFFAGGAGFILWIYEALCKWAAKLPYSLLLFGKPQIWQMAVYFVILAVSLFLWLGGGKRLFLMDGMKVVRKEYRIRGGFPLCVILLLPLLLLPVQSSRFEAAFLDVGQGDGIVIRERGGAVILVDGGSVGVQNVGEKRLIPYLKAKGIRCIDCVFVSHTDSDHISGIKEILEEMPVYSDYRESPAGYTGMPVIKSIALPVIAEPPKEYASLEELAREKHVKIYYLAAGDRISFGERLSFSCLAPKRDVAYADINAASMVLLASYEELDILLTGDMDAAGEAMLIEDGVLEGISVEILKVAHHGSYTASSKKFIGTIMPKVSVISCGKDNRYGHPHAETLKRLEEAGSMVYRTDQCGAVTVEVKRDKVRIAGYGR